MGSIIKLNLLTLIRDKGSLFFVMLFPSLLVFLLGNLLMHLDNADNVIDPITMHITVQTEDRFEISAIEALSDALNSNVSLNIVDDQDHEAAMEAVDKNIAAAAVLFTEPFAIEVYQGHDKIQNRAVDSIFRSFARQVAGLKTLAEVNPQALVGAANLASEDLVKQKEFGYNRNMLDYYAVVMIVMILFMGGAIGGASTLYDSRRDGSLQRMLVSPKSRTTMYIQSVLGATPQNILQVVCVMGFSVALFGAHYADTPGDNILLFVTLFIVGLSITALFMIVGLFIKVNPTLVLMPFMWILMFISGTFSKEIYIRGVSELSPIWQIQNAAFDLTVFGRPEKCLWVIAISFGLLLLFTFIGALLFNRKGVVIK